MNRSLADGQAWMAEGSQLVSKAITGLSEDEFDEPTLLPGWSRKHVVAHLAGNAEALLNLVHWALTGNVTPMYSSATQRAEDIERGARMQGPALTAWAAESETRLEQGMLQLTDAQWQAEVKTVQGRTLPATELPWLRSREALVHVVDLDLGVTFADLPDRFLQALVEDICTARRLDVEALPEGPLPDVAAWLAGRPHGLVDVPEIGAWL